MSAPLRIAVLGGSGRTGSLVVEGAHAADDIEVVATVSLEEPVAPGCFGDAEVVVDFSLPAALEAALPLLGDRALVTGTTGLDAGLRAALDAQATRGPVIAAPNFSTGVTLLLDLVERAARALPDYDVEVVESHHHHKLDAPSGTALALARAAADGLGTTLEKSAVYGRQGHTGARPARQIGIHALRMGDVVGEHQVWLAGQGDRISLGHVATSRVTFASGALRAARWVRGRPPGHYTMRDVLGLGR